MSKLRHRESWYSRTKKELEEMDYKEKYEKTLELAKSYYRSGRYVPLDILFPELRESEDERIREELIELVRELSEEPGRGGLTVRKTEMYISYLEKQKDQKPRDYRKLYEEVVNSEWFKKAYAGKSLGEEQKPEWSEADEVYLEDALWCVDKAEKSCKDDEDKGACWSAKRWLKSLRPSWKPSEEQMDALKSKLPIIKGTGNNVDSILESLYYDLKKL